MIAALYVETDGSYFGLPGIDAWDEVRDARTYNGPWPVVAHPPCQRWGRYWHGAPNKPHQYKLGDDAGCFASALAAVRAWGGVLEHPEGSHAWSGSMSYHLEPTTEELRAIRALKRIAKTWPKSLWLFSASGSLCVMRARQDGNHYTTPDGGIDPEYVFETVNIPNDGGDW